MHAKETRIYLKASILLWADMWQTLVLSFMYDQDIRGVNSRNGEIRWPDSWDQLVHRKLKHFTEANFLRLSKF